jgi:hypothetical protein
MKYLTNSCSKEFEHIMKIAICHNSLIVILFWPFAMSKEKTAKARKKQSET